MYSKTIVITDKIKNLHNNKYYKMDKPLNTKRRVDQILLDEFINNIPNKRLNLDQSINSQSSQNTQSKTLVWFNYYCHKKQTDS